MSLFSGLNMGDLEPTRSSGSEAQAGVVFCAARLDKAARGRWAYLLCPCPLLTAPLTVCQCQ